MKREASGLKLSLGDKAPDFNLPGTDGKNHSLSDFAGKKALVVIFCCNHCPYVRAYDERLLQLANDYQARDAQFVAICSNDSVTYPDDDFEHMKALKNELGLPYPYLHDEDQSVAKAYDAACTPEIFLFDADQKLAYHGQIDDNHRDPNAVKSHDLRNALDAVLAGETPERAMTMAIGCSIKWK